PLATTVAAKVRGLEAVRRADAANRVPRRARGFKRRPLSCVGERKRLLGLSERLAVGNCLRNGRTTRTNWFAERATHRSSDPRTVCVCARNSTPPPRVRAKR